MAYVVIVDHATIDIIFDLFDPQHRFRRTTSQRRRVLELTLRLVQERVVCVDRPSTMNPKTRRMVNQFLTEFCDKVSGHNGAAGEAAMFRLKEKHRAKFDAPQRQPQPSPTGEVVEAPVVERQASTSVGLAGVTTAREL